MSSTYRNSLNEWLKQLDVQADRVLDIGGAQEKLPPRVKSWNVNEYIIADLPEPHKDSPKPDVEMDLNLPDNGHFDEDIDIIFCLEVFDYIYNPIEAFRTIETYLKKGGTAWISFPSIYPLHQPIEDDALRYMPAAINKLANAVGLQVIEMIPRLAETYAFMDFCRAERLRAAKGQDHRIMGYIVRFTK